MSNNSSVSHSSNIPINNSEAISHSSDAESLVKSEREPDNASEAQNETHSIHSLPEDLSSRILEDSEEGCEQEMETDLMGESSNREDLGAHEPKPFLEQGKRGETTCTSQGPAVGNESKMTSEVSGVDRSTTYFDDDNLDAKDHPQAFSNSHEQQSETAIPCEIDSTVGTLDEHETPVSPVGLLQQALSTQRRYLRRNEYLSAVMGCTITDFTNPPNPTMQEAFANGKYEQLLGYANALDEAGQISNAQEVIILATAQCFRPLGLLQQVDQHFELTANVLKHCRSLARGRLLRFLQTMLDRAPAAFIPRGEAFIPILDGFAAVLESFADVIPLASRAQYDRTENCDEIMERWRVERENAGLTMGILQWLARQPAHWASLNGSRMLLLSLAGLVTDPSIDRVIHGMIIDYIALNQEYLHSMDLCLPEHVVVDTIISTIEHALGNHITSIQYPEYMHKLKLSETDADMVLSATLTTLYHYSAVIPGDSSVLARLTDSLTEFVSEESSNTKYRAAICHTMRRLFERFPEEFEVDEKFVKTLGRLWVDDSCREQAVSMMQIIQDRCRDEGHTA